MKAGFQPDDVVLHGILGDLAYRDSLKGYVAIPFSGQHYMRTPVHSSTATVVFTANNTYYSPIYLPKAMTIDAIGLKTGTGAAGTNVARVALYEHNYITGKPGRLLVDAGTISIAASNTIGTAVFTTAITLPEGLYWLASNVTSAGTAVQYYGFNAGIGVHTPIMGAVSSTIAGNIFVGYTEAINVSAGYTDAGTLAGAIIIPHVWARVQ